MVGCFMCACVYLCVLGSDITVSGAQPEITFLFTVAQGLPVGTVVHTHTHFIKHIYTVCCWLYSPQ